MKNELLITELKYECKYFADKLAKRHKGIRIEFNVYDEQEFFNDTHKENEWVK